MEKRSFKTKKLTQNKTKYFDISTDIIVPDSKPDIVNLISEDANLFIYKTDILNSKIRLDGNINLNISYMSDEGEVKVINSFLNLVEQVDDSDITEKSRIEYDIDTYCIDAKVLNERKITVKIIFKFDYRVYTDEMLELPDYSSISLENVEKLDKKIKIKEYLGTGNAKASIKEKIKLDSDINLVEIIKMKTNIKNIENKISINKILTKADVELSLIYLDDNSRIMTKKEVFPISAFVDIDGMTDKFFVESTYRIKNVKVMNDLQNKNEFLIEIDLDIFSSGFTIKEIDVIEDLYILGKDVNISKKFKSILTLNDGVNEENSINERVKIDGLVSIYDMDVKISRDENSNNLNLLVDLYYEKEGMSNLSYKTVSIPIMLKDFWNKALLENNIKIKIIDQKYQVNNEYCELEIKIELKMNEEFVRDLNYVDSIEIKDRIDDESKMCMYFIKKDDTIWKIAKEFNVSKDELMRINNLEDENITLGDKLFIVK